MAIQNDDLYVLQQGEIKYNITYAQLKDNILAGTSAPIIASNPPSVNENVQGTLWWNDTTGQLYILYFDPSGDKYWVNTTTPENPNASRVTVSPIPPLNPQEGALWWKDDAGILYVYYLDPTGDQYWVDTNPAGEPAGGSGGDYTLPIATATELGGIKVGTGLTINAATGVLDASATGYTLPVASADTLGGVKIGDGLSMSTETLSADLTGVGDGLDLTNGSVSLEVATADNLGGVKIGTGITVTADGTISATTGDITGVTAGEGLTGGGTSGDITLNVNPGDGVIITDDKVTLDLNGATLSLTTAGLAVANAPVLTTARSLWGQSFNGSADVTGTITVGSSAIVLNNDGTSSFTDDLTVGSEITGTDSNTGVTIYKTGAIYGARSGGTDDLFVGYTAGVTTQTCNIKASGAAMFNESVSIPRVANLNGASNNNQLNIGDMSVSAINFYAGDTLSSITIRNPTNNTSASFSISTDINDDDTFTPVFFIRQDGTVQIGGDLSDFSLTNILLQPNGTITAKNYSIDSLPTLP